MYESYSKNIIINLIFTKYGAFISIHLRENLTLMQLLSLFASYYKNALECKGQFSCQMLCDLLYRKL